MARLTKAETRVLAGVPPSVAAFLSGTPDIDASYKVYAKIARAARAELEAITYTRALASAKGEPLPEQRPVLEAVSAERASLERDVKALESELARLRARLASATAAPSLAVHSSE